MVIYSLLTIFLKDIANENIIKFCCYKIFFPLLKLKNKNL
jgi:hypothetical protein